MGLFDMSFGGSRGGILGGAARSNGGLLDGGPEQPKWAQYTGIIGAALRDAGASLEGKEGGYLQSYQQQNQGAQIRKQLVDALTSPDPAIRQKAYAVAPMFGVDPAAFQKQQAAQALPGVLDATRRSTEALDPITAQLPKFNIPTAGGGTMQAGGMPVSSGSAPMLPKLSIQDAIAQSNSPELQQQYAPEIIKQQMEMDQKKVTPASAEWKRANGYDPRVPIFLDVYGNPTIKEDPFAITPKDERTFANQDRSFGLQERQFGETVRNNQVSNNIAMLNATDAVAARKLANTKAQQELRDRELTRTSQAASYDTAIQTLDRLKTHPGFKSAVGFGAEKAIRGVLPFVDAEGVTPGTARADFMAELDAFKAQSFLPMVAQLKGMGALSDAEGKKLSEAVGALSASMSEPAFITSVDRIKADLDAARMRLGGAARQRDAQKPVPGPAALPRLPSASKVRTFNPATGRLE